MSKYFKVYLTSKTGKISKQKANNKADVMRILNQAKKEGFLSYMVVKRIKPDTDVPIGRGNFYEECKVSFVESLDVDWQVVGQNVVDWNKFKKHIEGEER